MAEDYEVFNTGSRHEYRRLTRCRHAATTRIEQDVFGNTDVCFCARHTEEYESLKAVRVFRLSDSTRGASFTDYRRWCMKPVVGAKPRYIARYGEVEELNPNERSHHARRHWLQDGREDDLALWVGILRSREEALDAHRAREKELFAEVATLAQKVTNMQEERAQRALDLQRRIESLIR